MKLNQNLYVVVLKGTEIVASTAEGVLISKDKNSLTFEMSVWNMHPEEYDIVEAKIVAVE